MGFSERPMDRTLKLKQLFKNILLCLFFLGISACARQSTEAVDLSFAIPAAPRTLDVRFATDATSFRIGQLMYKAPVTFNDKSQPIPWLCEWEEITPQHFRLRIQEGASFSTNKPITSADIKATYDSILNKDTGSPHRGSVAHIDTIEVVDSQKVDFFLKRADPLFLSTLAIGVLPKSWLENPQGQAPSSGNYILDEPWEEGGGILLKRRSDDFKLRFVVSRDPTIRVLKLLKGEVQLLQNNLPPELIAWLSSKNEVNVKKHSGSTFAYLGFNLKDPLLADHKLRLAIAHAIDRDTIIKYLFAGAARKANAILPPEHWASASGLTSYQYNTEKASALLKEIGINPENRIRLSFKTSKDPLRLRLASVIQAQLQPLGIDLDIQSYDWGTFYDDIKAGRFQLYSLAWVGVKGIDIFRYVHHSEAIPPNGANRGSYISLKVNALIEKIEHSNDLSIKKQLLNELQSQILADLPYVPLWYEDNVAISIRNAKNYNLSNDGNYLDLNNYEIKVH